MTKLEEMWEALALYQPQATANGHGDSWAKMCSEKTHTAAYYAANAARDAAYDDHDAHSADSADIAANAAEVAANAAAAACPDYPNYTRAYAAAYVVDNKVAVTATTNVWIQKAINRITKITEVV